MKKLLVVRNDKLGDFMLAWPAFAMLKQSAPDWHITALVPPYTESMARSCPYIDEVIIDAGKTASKVNRLLTLAEIKKAKFDAVINFFSDTYNALMMYKAGIPFRMAPATKLVQFLYNQRVIQRRSRSLKPEYEYNLDLARAFLIRQGLTIQEPLPPYLSIDQHIIYQQKNKLAAQLGISLDLPWIFVHAGSGGSANNLTLHQYAMLITTLIVQLPCAVVLTAGPGESEKAQALLTRVQSMLVEDNAKITDEKGRVPYMLHHSLIHEQRLVVYDRNDGLMDFAQSLACAKVFIAGSTGPLHVCGALDVPTIGFYPSKRSATPLRWKTLNSDGRHLAFAPKAGADTEDDLTTIDMEQVIQHSLPFIRQHLA